MRRRDFMKAAGAVAGLSTVTACELRPLATCDSAYTAGSNLPNVIYILADDLGYGDLSIMGGKKLRTPNIDRIGYEGIVFTDHYSGNTVCSPGESDDRSASGPCRLPQQRHADAAQAPGPEDGDAAPSLQERGVRNRGVRKVGAWDNVRKRVRRRGDWKIVQKYRRGKPGPSELFNLKDDLGETTNLATGNPKIVKRLEKLMDDAHQPSPALDTRHRSKT